MSSEEEILEQDSNNKSLVKSDDEPVEQSSPEKASADDGILIPDDIDQMPPEVAKSFRSVLAMFSQSISSTRANPIIDKFNEAHIDKYLDYIQRDDDHEYELKKSNRWFYLAYAVIALGVFSIGVIYLLPRDRDLLMQLITLIVMLGGGIGAGYGLSKK